MAPDPKRKNKKVSKNVELELQSENNITEDVLTTEQLMVLYPEVYAIKLQREGLLDKNLKQSRSRDDALLKFIMEGGVKLLEEETPKSDAIGSLPQAFSDLEDSQSSPLPV